MKPLKYKIEIQLKPYAGRTPAKEIYDTDTETAAWHIYDFFKLDAKTREMFEYRNDKYVKINSLKLEKCGT